MPLSANPAGKLHQVTVIIAITLLVALLMVLQEYSGVGSIGKLVSEAGPEEQYGVNLLPESEQINNLVDSTYTIAAGTAENSTYSQNEIDAFNLINAERTSRGIAALALNGKITGTCTRPWAQNMANSNSLSHDPNYEGCLRDLDFQRGSENVGLNGGGASDIVQAWMNSSAHRANILDSSFSDAGIAMRGSSNKYWDMDFGGEYRPTSTQSNPPTGGTSQDPSYITTIQNGNFSSSIESSELHPYNVRSLGKWYKWEVMNTKVLKTTCSSCIEGNLSRPDVLKIDDCTRVKVGVDWGNCWGAATQLLKGISGRTYTLSAKALRINQPGSGQLIRLQFLNSSYANIGLYSASVLPGRTDWQSPVITKIAPKNTEYIRVWMYAGAGDTEWSVFVWDDVSLTW